MNTTTRAVVVHSAGDLRLDTIVLPVPAPNEVVLRVAYGGICGSDLHYWRHGAVGESVLRTPLVLGHEVTGTVEVAAADGSGPLAGTPVAVHPARVRPSEVRFPADRPNLSPGVRYLGSAATVPHTQGAFAQRAVLPATMLRPLPPGLDLRTAAVAEPASVAWHAVARAGDLRGRSVLVVGVGPIGALIIAIAKRAGARDIVAVDLHEAALRTARALGATATIRATDTAAIAAADADIAFEASGNHRGLGSAIHGTTRGGTLVMVGLLPTGPQPLPISIAITRELQLVGSFRFVDEIDEVLEALADGSLDADAVITGQFVLEELADAFSLAADPARSCKVLLSM